MLSKALLAAAALGALASSPASPAVGIAQTDRTGRIRAMSMDGESIAIRTDLRIPLAGWKRLPNMGQARDVKSSHADGKRTWTGTIEVAKGKAYRYEQTLKEKDGAVLLALRVTAQADVKTEGVFLWLDLPIAHFGGGECDLSLGRRATRSAVMPRTQRKNRHFLNATAGHAVFTGPEGEPRLDVWLIPAAHVAVQDNREWNAQTYSALIRFGGQLRKGQTARLDVRLKLSGEGDHSPAKLTLDASRVRYRLDGIGGNYCFGIESPVSQYTLEHLRVAWARTEMTLPEWEPTNDDALPEHTDWKFLTSHDQPGTNLRREFLLAQQIQKRGIPYSITIWHLPEWLYEKPRRDKERPNRRRLAPGKWPELLECVGSYLLYAKRQYGVEPNLFSFNEPGIGVRVRFTPEEHRDVIKRMGRHFEKLGLRTKMLLGDVTRPKVAHGYVEPAAKDPEAMRHVGALGFHSWGGASPEQYARWADMADRLKLPLLVAELGVDAGAWRGRAYNTFAYGLREVRMYQELLLHARPRGTMQWEFTSDYGIVAVEKGKDGKAKLVPTPRFWFVKHFCDLTPPNADALTTSSDHEKVLFTAFAAKAGGHPVHTLHIANFGAARAATITGIPAAIKSLRAVRTSASDSFKELPPIAVKGGVVRTPLASQSLLTLTTLPAR